MSTDDVTPLGPAKGRPLPSRKVLVDRGSAATNDLARVSRMLKMLSLLITSEALTDDHTDELEGVHETLDCAVEIVENVMVQVDCVTFLAPEPQS